MTKAKLRVLVPAQKKALIDDIYKHRKRQCCGERDMPLGFIYLAGSSDVVAGYLQECPVCEKVYARMFEPADGTKMIDKELDIDATVKLDGKKENDNHPAAGQ